MGDDTQAFKDECQVRFRRGWGGSQRRGKEEGILQMKGHTNTQMKKGQGKDWYFK